MIPRLGIELEYMIVDRDTLDVKPIADKLLAAQAGEITGEVEVGDFCWSNELVLHVVELKTNGPVESLAGLSDGFHRQVVRINELLAQWNACLMPAAMHPWMDPLKETKVWPHDNNEVYEAFNRIFSCTGHGWSNLQSMHINLPFANDEEFGRLHAAIRLILPILPALAASSPIMEGRATGLLDNRLDVYRTNCAKIPSLTGDVIPEPVFAPAEYEEVILQRCYRDIKPFDPDGILQYEWVNARGAIARFERNTIEIRLIDVQECPAADIAIGALVITAIEALMDERWAAWDKQKAQRVEPLKALLLDTIREGDQAVIRNADYLASFGLTQPAASAGQLWSHIAGQLSLQISGRLTNSKWDAPSPLLKLQPGFSQIPLSRRLLSRLAPQPMSHELRSCARSLTDALARNQSIASGD